MSEPEPWPYARTRLPSPAQLDRIEALARELGIKIPRGATTEAEAYRWIGELGGRIQAKREGRPDESPPAFETRGERSRTRRPEAGPGQPRERSGRMPTCRGSTCNAAIQFAAHPDRLEEPSMCLDVEGRETGEGETRWVITNRRHKGRPVLRRAEPGEFGVLSHHATCPNRGEFQRRKS